jgi:hypothetical protein
MKGKLIQSYDLTKEESSRSQDLRASEIAAYRVRTPALKARLWMILRNLHKDLVSSRGSGSWWIRLT